MGRKSSTFNINAGELMSALKPFAGTPLQVTVSKKWADGLKVLGINLKGTEAAEVDEDADETEEAEPAETEKRPAFKVE